MRRTTMNLKLEWKKKQHYSIIEEATYYIIKVSGEEYDLIVKPSHMLDVLNYTITSRNTTKANYRHNINVSNLAIKNIPIIGPWNNIEEFLIDEWICVRANAINKK